MPGTLAVVALTATGNTPFPPVANGRFKNIPVTLLPPTLTDLNCTGEIAGLAPTANPATCAIGSPAPRIPAATLVPGRACFTALNPLTPDPKAMSPPVPTAIPVCTARGRTASPRPIKAVAPTPVVAAPTAANLRASEVKAPPTLLARAPLP